MIGAADTNSPNALADRMRIPLQTGTSAARDMIFGTVPTQLILLGICGPMVWQPEDNWTLLVLLVGSVGGALTFLNGVLTLQKHGATDLEIGANELVIRGGRSDGTAIPYVDIDPAKVEFVQSEYDKDGYGKFPEGGLEIGRRDGSVVQLSRIMDLGEERFFLEETLALVTALASTEVAPAPAVGADVLTCDRCGNLVVPSAAFTTSCQSCDELVYIPEAVRQAIESNRVFSVSERETQTIVRRLLRLPKAAQVNRMLYVFFALTVGHQYLTVWALQSESLSLVITAYCMLHAYYQLLRRYLARRVGFRSLVFFGNATRDVGKESLPACRNCGALLPVNAENGLIVRCAYCNASSLLGINAPWRTHRIVTSQYNLGTVLSTVDTVNRRCKGRLVLLGLVLMVSVPILIDSPPW